MTPFRVAEIFRSARVSRGLRVVEAARLAGMRDTPKVLRHIERLETGGLAPLHVVRSLCAFFGIDLQEVREAWKLDETERKRRAWESAGGQPYLVIRFMPSVYRQSSAPEGLDRKKLIAWARSVLTERWKGHFEGCLVLSPYEIAWFGRSGGYEIRSDVPAPSMSIRGKRFMFTE